MFFVKINDALYPANFNGSLQDSDWNGRNSKSITFYGTFEQANALFPDGVAWSIIEEHLVPVLDEEGHAVLDENNEPMHETTQTEFDNSDYSVRGDLIVHTNGTVTVKMGKPTDLEETLELLYGGIE